MKIVVDGKEVEIPSGGGGSGVPSGFIGMWSGDSVPDGWALCDGANGTPDLRGRFVFGQSDSYTMGDTGGEEEVTLTIEQMPSHSHQYNLRNAKSSMYSSTSGTRVDDVAYGNLYTNSQKTGGNEAHNNMPPYYVLAYIMKL